ncbi:MAG: enoyl-CoA hydratase/carnithine racemase [Candidatus Azotimanducaceae bacterium]
MVGAQRANLMFLTGRRINGETANEWGLGDIYTETDDVRQSAIALAQEIAENAPLALLSLREQMRSGLADAVNDVTTIESREQKWLQQTIDHKEGIKAVGEKRAGNFTSS